ncbi:hypothetical protein LGM54_35240 [Burkholderia cenocepacia]|uniref:hypothetical protein n=1 Tax=Burkholderia cenocepacia TaxID=95486 RepID=UPI001B90672C|nr:hypothetical protein [Burkholderia cenocepacia]MBR8311536.1 hypothetical protein [Burkholderia cenocepacia]MCA7968222.1 hypothetical protein [Burkholderia cenocepacia]
MPEIENGWPADHCAPEDIHERVDVTPIDDPLQRARRELDLKTGGGMRGQRILDAFCGCIESGDEPSLEMLQAVAALFRGVMAGGLWEVAFPLPGRVHVAPRKYQRAESKDGLDVKIVLAMDKRRREHPDETVMVSMKRVGASFNRGHKVVERAWYGEVGKLLRKAHTK